MKRKNRKVIRLFHNRSEIIKKKNGSPQFVNHCIRHRLLITTPFQAMCVYLVLWSYKYISTFYCFSSIPKTFHQNHLVIEAGFAGFACIPL